MDQKSPAAFDYTDPMEIMCDHFRKEVMDLYIAADRITIFRELSDEQKLNSFMSGLLVGMLIVPIAGTSGRIPMQHLIQPIKAGLPASFEQAMSIYENTGR